MKKELLKTVYTRTLKLLIADPRQSEETKKAAAEELAARAVASQLRHLMRGDENTSDRARCGVEHKKMLETDGWFYKD